MPTKKPAKQTEHARRADALHGPEYAAFVAHIGTATTISDLQAIVGQVYVAVRDGMLSPAATRSVCWHFDRKFGEFLDAFAAEKKRTPRV